MQDTLPYCWHFELHKSSRLLDRIANHSRWAIDNRAKQTLVPWEHFARFMFKANILVEHRLYQWRIYRRWCASVFRYLNVSCFFSTLLQRLRIENWISKNQNPSFALCLALKIVVGIILTETNICQFVESELIVCQVESNFLIREWFDCNDLCGCYSLTYAMPTLGASRCSLGTRRSPFWIGKALFFAIYC